MGGWSAIYVYAADRFHSDMLQAMARTLGIANTLTSLPEGYHYKAFNYHGKNITVGIVNDEIVHIGYSLVGNSQREFLGGIADFVERYCLWLALPIERDVSPELQMHQDKVMFETGSLKSISSIVNDTTLNLSYEEVMNKRCRVTWKKDGNIVCRLSFPINHELLLGRNMSENDRRLSNEIRATKTYKSVTHHNCKELKPTGKEGCYVLEQGTFLIDELKLNRYFTIHGKDSCRLVYSPSHRYETVANMLTGTELGQSANFALTLRQQTYNYKQVIIEMNIQQYVSYCLNTGCVPYVGLIGDDGQTVEVELIMKNEAMGYAHVARMRVNLTEMEQGRGTAVARLNPFIPIANVKNFFDE